MNSEDPVNFRPIANVSFVSKIIEKIAAYQLTVYLETNKLLPECQFGFRRGHSTEILLLHLLSDIYGAVDTCSSQLTLLALFDVSSAFDTVDNEILFKRLEISFGLSGNFLSWVGSFLSERSLCVVHGPSRSAWVPAPYGLSQDSVLGPLLYIIYTSEIGPLLTATSVLSHLYADDIQAYVHCSASNATSAVLAISKTLVVFETWMSTNRLRLNPSKTQFIWFGTRQHSEIGHPPSLLISPILSFPLLFVTLELHWIKSSPLLHIFTASVVIHATSYASSALLFACSLQMLWSLAHFRCHSYTYPCLNYSPTRLLQLTLCWPPEN